MLYELLDWDIDFYAFLEGVYMRFFFGQNSVPGQTLVDVNMKYHEIKLIAGVISLQSF